MSAKRKVIVFKDGGNEAVSLFKRSVKAKYKTPIDCILRRGDLMIKTELSVGTIIKIFPDWELKHQTEKRIVLEKKE